MNNIGKNVDSMNFEELRSFVKVLANDVQELSDLYAKTKREYNDMLYNLSRDNLSIEYIQEEKEFVNSTVGNKMKDYSTIEQTDEKIASSVISNKEYVDTKLTKYSTTEQTAEKIATSVSETKQYVDEKLGDVDLTNYTTIEQTADSIKTIAAKQVNLKNAIEVKEITNQLEEKEIYKTCEYSSDGKITSETYYYYDELGNEWIPFQADNIYTVFQQTAEGFEFKGNVVIDGDVVALKNISADRIYSKEYPDGGYYLKIFGEFGDFGVFSPYAGETNNITGGCIFSVYNNAAEVGMNVNSRNILIVADDETRAIGKWKFSGTVEGLGVVPVFG